VGAVDAVDFVGRPFAVARQVLPKAEALELAVVARRHRWTRVLRGCREPSEKEKDEGHDYADSAGCGSLF